ncbi:MAG: HEPN domain-containing protein [Verrucomicrobiota bacterium]|nr:HEPN domain-containing protein [Verrucomicrobiota bacterium]
MNEIEHCSSLLGMAQKDLNAMSAMEDSKLFAEEIFGFHTQQAVEKTLKSWLAFLNIEYPFRHDLAELLNLLEQNGAEISGYKKFIIFTPFAVEFRYDSSDVDEFMDRKKICAEVQELLVHVQKLITPKS